MPTGLKLVDTRRAEYERLWKFDKCDRVFEELFANVQFRLFLTDS